MFLDTFDRSEVLYSDINSNLTARQAGGTTGTSYTKTMVGAGGGVSRGIFQPGITGAYEYFRSLKIEG